MCVCLCLSETHKCGTAEVEQTKLPRVKQAPYLWLTTLEPLPVNDASQNIKEMHLHERKGSAQSEKYIFISKINALYLRFQPSFILDINWWTSRVPELIIILQ